MKRILHAAIVLAAAPPFVIACAFLSVSLILVLLAHWLWPQADRGNCWSYVAPRWWFRGGYMVVRWSEPLFAVLGHEVRIPHAIWTGSLGSAELRQTAPIRRSKNPLATLYFRFDVRRVEKPRPTAPGAMDSRP